MTTVLGTVEAAEVVCTAVVDSAFSLDGDAAVAVVSVDSAADGVVLVAVSALVSFEAGVEAAGVADDSEFLVVSEQ